MASSSGRKVSADLEALSLAHVEPHHRASCTDRSGSPDRELAAVVGGTEPLATVIAFPGRPAAADPRPKRGATSGSVFQLKITLLDTKPPIWRRVLVDGSSTLDHLHEIIQAAFGWWNCHLHEFEVGRKRYGIPIPGEDWGEPPQDERRTRLDAIAREGSSFRYTYDFGDGWDHRIVVEKVTAQDRRRRNSGVHRRPARLPTRGLRWDVGLPRAARDPRRPDPPRARRATGMARPTLRPRGVRPERVRGQPPQRAARRVRRRRVGASRAPSHEPARRERSTRSCIGANPRVTVRHDS